MKEHKFLKNRIYFTAIATIAKWSLLGWGYFNGGVPAHHILNNENLPEISNWWGGLLIPLLTWLLLYRIEQRWIKTNTEKSVLLKKTLYGFFGGLIFGIVLSAFFMSGNDTVPGYMMIGLLVLALFLPIYRAECLLGFVIGMTFTFGAVLPTGIGSILLLISLILYLYIRPGILYIASGIMRMASSGKQKADH
jgi:hypothetical protein